MNQTPCSHFSRRRGKEEAEWMNSEHPAPLRNGACSSGGDMHFNVKQVSIWKDCCTAVIILPSKSKNVKLYFANFSPHRIVIFQVSYRWKCMCNVQCRNTSIFRKIITSSMKLKTGTLSSIDLKLSASYADRGGLDLAVKWGGREL